MRYLLGPLRGAVVGLVIATAVADLTQAQPANGAAGAAAQTTPPPPTSGAVFSFVSNTVSLPVDSSSGDGALIIHMLVKKPNLTPSVREFGASTAGSIKVDPGAVTALGDTAAGDWLIPLKVAGLQQNTTLSRYLQVTYGDAFQTLGYTIKNTPTEKFTWNILSLGGVLSWSQREPIAATVIVGPIPATNLMVNAVLTDDTSAKRLAAGDLQVCANRDGNCQLVTTLAANQAHRLFLRPPPDIQLTPGKYVGSIEFVASQDKSAATQITVYVTDDLHMLFGVLAILIGVLCSFGITVGIRNALARKQLLAPTAELRDTFSKLNASLIAEPVKKFPAPTTSARIKDWEDRLSDNALEDQGFVPSWSSVAAPSTTRSQAYQQLLEKAGAWTVALARIINTGLVPLANLANFVPTGLAGSNRQTVDQAIQKAWAAVDELAVKLANGPPNAPTPDGLDATIAAQIRTAQAALASAGGVQADFSGPAAPTEYDRLRFQISILSFASWIVAALITALVGCYVMVLSHLDFGRSTDFFVCFFWGLGLPTAAAQLAQITPASLAGSLGVSLPKLGAS